MAVTLTQLLQWIGIPNNTQRSAIIAEMMPDGIGALKGLIPDNIRKTCEGFEANDFIGHFSDGIEC